MELYSHVITDVQPRHVQHAETANTIMLVKLFHVIALAIQIIIFVFYFTNAAAESTYDQTLDDCFGTYDFYW